MSLNKKGTCKIKHLKVIVYYMSIVATTNAAAFGIEKKIFCYGDSLTAGTTPGREPYLFPYATPLEQDLKTMIDSEMNVMVRWRGLPGWSASEMVNQQDVDGVGLRHALSNKSVDLAVILAGTNDLGYVIETMDMDSAAREISKSVTSLHTVAHTEGVPTLAISIPDSGFQSQVPIAKKIAMKANENIKKWCLENSRMCSYLEFPFGWNADDDRWADDGLHFSEKGYFEIARAIAPTVYKIGCS